MNRYLSGLSSRVNLYGDATLGLAWTLGLSLAAASVCAQSPTTLADQPIFTSASVPGNLLLVLSVEYPTAIDVANLGDYNDASTYYGYFDPAKCYTYLYNGPGASGSTTPTLSNTSYFKPAAFVASGTHQCNKGSVTGTWSGNFMNWATTQAIDPFRSTLTGGYRLIDTTTSTILQKAYGSNQGSNGGAGSDFPIRGSTQTGNTPAGTSNGNYLNPALIPYLTPLTGGVGTVFEVNTLANGFYMAYYYTTAYSTIPNGTCYYGAGCSQGYTDTLTKYLVAINVDVCDATPLGVAGLESNCVQYGSYYKPQGLLQQYANQIKYGVMGYPYGNGALQQGGILREPMGFVGPTYPTPLSTAVTTNSRPEWSSTTGVMNPNPDPTLASSSGVTNSGVMNYLNKFGESAQQYMSYDDVSILYYAAVRYFENLGNSSNWSASGLALDGFPQVTNWADPISYSCQKNFILGIGDANTHNDTMIPTSTVSSYEASGVTAPAYMTSDTLNLAQTWLTDVQTMEGLSTSSPWWQSGDYATYYIAGLAYGAHTTDIRPDLTGTQTISTYWMDVMEYGVAIPENQYYLATKYGGFAVPSGYTPGTTPLTQGEWTTSGNSIYMAQSTSSTGANFLQPDNYFEGGQASQMISSLKSAFSSIATSALTQFTTSFSLSTPVVTSTGSASYSAQYNSSGWTGSVVGGSLTINSSGTGALAQSWTSDSTLNAQLAGSGYVAPYNGTTGRYVLTWNGSAGVPFEPANLTSTQLSALTPSYATTITSTQYVNYLRGDATNEVGSTASGSTRSLRARSLRLGDIVDASLAAVGAPILPYTESYNPGYAAFKSTYANRATVVYAAANDGMVHAFNGALTGSGAGTELFAYIPSAVISGPNSTPQINGLAALGNPTFAHNFFVDATPAAFDIDFNNSGGTFTSTNAATSHWHTLLIGGLGKGGTSYYALDITNPTSPAVGTAESTMATAHVLWEFSDNTMGYSFGTPIVVKTAKYGWVVAFTSGYDNSGGGGYGYLYLVNPTSGQLLEKIQTPSASTGLTQASAYVQDYSDETADSIYAGDLNGQVWRFNLTEAKGGAAAYPQPTLLATLKDASGNPQPITTAPLIQIYPSTSKRFVMIGTGELLSTSDVSSTAIQTFYALEDGTAVAFSSISTPIVRANLQQETSVTSGITLTSAVKGWYYDLGSDVTSGIAYRIVVTPVGYNGTVAFTDLLTTTNPCSPGGSSRIYALNYATGVSQLAVGTTTTGYLAFNTNVTNLAVLSVGTSSTTNSTTAASTTSVASFTYGLATANGANKIQTTSGAGLSTRLLNWREIPTAQ